MKMTWRNTATGGGTRRGIAKVGAVAAPLIALTAAFGVAAPIGAAGASGSFTGEPIAVGTSAPINTAGANDVQVQDAATAAVDAINAAGGIKTADGKTHQLKLDFCNNQDTPNGSVTCAQTLIGDNVAAIVGNDDQNSTNSDPLYTKAGIPNFANDPLSEWDFAGSDSYPLGSGGTFSFAGVASELGKAGIKTARLVSVQETEADTQPIIAAFKASYAKVGGTMLAPTYFPEATTDYSPVAAQADAGDPGAIVIVANPQFVAPLAQAVVQLGGKPPNFANFAGAITPQVLKTTGSLFNGALIASQFSSTSSPQWAAYRAAMKKYEPQANPELVYGITPVAAQMAWLGMESFKTVVSKLSGTITAAKVKTALNGTTDLTTGGITPPINFTKGFACGPFSRVFNTTYYGPTVVKNGQFVPAADAKLQNNVASSVIAGFGASCQATAAQLGVS